MAKNTKYLQYAKSRSKVQQNIDLQQITLEYDKLLNKKFCYLFSGGIRIEFQFKMENFYHLLGFHKLTDVTAVRMVEAFKLKKEDFFKLIKAGKITMTTTDEKIIGEFSEEIVNIQDTKRKSDFGEIKAHRLLMFSEKNILELLLSDPVIDFDSDECNTVIDADKIFFKLITGVLRHLNLFIGYDTEEKNHYVSTFFLENEADKFLLKKSGEPQTQLKILTREVYDTTRNEMIDFYVKWENVREEFVQEPCYRGQNRLKTWINSKHISSSQVVREIVELKEIIEQYKQEVEELTRKYAIAVLVSQLSVEEKKEDAQLQLMEYDIDAEREDVLVEYHTMDISQIKNDKLRMEAKLSAVENKLQKYEKYLPEIVELEKKEVVLVYQPYMAEQAIEDTLIVKLLEDNDVFGNIVSPSKFKEWYMKLHK